ncbi:endo-1,4-beta-xylanase [Longimicrobium terrae]|uniref:Beta-xylanase n=1 Tax=Longimicrobium terrae TaxID=1639882 RepID=A0A841H3U9_9BACT|nr:endo-1,4-beta-xylanase [Longimicrobium terrae]MBB4638483.1 endo-1,4-beta-xylanase [Longimicrobium terrae]MBB6072674.1 endo-1,4-beta-xylanase [Longimicrobium terrae]NNC32450.1 endo-1,4-beta-xylanase [Longimicrobium terrae]
MKMQTRGALAAVLLPAALAAQPGRMEPPAPVSSFPSLKAAYPGLRMGTTLNLDEVYGRDLRGGEIIRHHFSAISPENLLKWESAQPQPGRFAFEAADRYVELGERNGQFIVGHALVWHSQTPAWVFQNADGSPASRDTLLARMRNHIHTVVGRYRGRIGGWDVVNEALDEDGTLRRSPWLNIIGPDFIAQAFRFANEADPQAELYYNDYSLENPAKRAGAVRLIRDLQRQGVRVTAVGLQGHHKMDWPTIAAEDSTITAFADLGVKVAITELDIDVLPRVVPGNTAEISARGEAAGCNCESNPYVLGMPDSVQQALAQRYAQFFDLYRRRSDVVKRVTFWGVSDDDSWLNDWPLRGRTNHPLLFGWRGEPKAAFFAVLRAASPGGGQAATATQSEPE